MVLVDTSVWIDHLRSENNKLSKLLEQGEAYIHPMIIGELACCNLGNRQELLSLWRNLPYATQASHEEVITCIEINNLMGKGIAFIDAHLFTSTLLTANTLIWTLDKRLSMQAEELDLCWQNPH